MAKGKLYGVGVGPGDPGLVTIKAKEIIETAGCIAVPKTKMEKESLALSIVKEIVGEGKDILELLFPMSFDEKVLEASWSTALEAIRAKLDSGCDVAFITLGDPTVYSTYIYMHKTLKLQGYEAVIIPGVTSFCASAAAAGISLAENRETLAVVPSAYECGNLDEILDEFDNIVLMKVSRSFGRIRDRLKAKGLDKKAVLVQRCGLPDEACFHDLDAVDEGAVSYFTTMIIKKSGVE